MRLDRSVLGFASIAMMAAIGCIAPGESTDTTGAPLRPDVPPGKPTEIQLLSISDWHGQLDPVAIGSSKYGGAAYLSTLFKQARAANPNTLTFTGGDAVGASPAISGLFEDRPAIEALNLMGLDADTFGNHNFDAGLDRIRKQIDWASFAYVTSNLAGSPTELPGASHPYHLLQAGPVKVGVIGITNDDAPSLIFPGKLGSLTVQRSADAAQTAIHAARAGGAEVVVVLVHMGATGVDGAGAPTGPLIDFAAELAARSTGEAGADVIFGDHTDMEVNTRVGRALVVENKSKGVTYSAVTLHVAGSKVLDSRAEIRSANNAGVTPDSAVNSLIASYQSKLGTVFSNPIPGAKVTGVFKRDGTVERIGEAAIGNVVADSMRAAYGTQIAFTNGGGIRSSLPSSFSVSGLVRTGCSTATPCDLVVGDAYNVLPFGNVVVTRTVTGAQLKAALENGVSKMPSKDGRFPQISGFRFTYTTALPVGSRVTSITLADGTDVLANPTASITAAVNDFINAGGDFYSALSDGQGTGRENMMDVLLAYLTGKTLAPVTDGRITRTP
jgi:5'-nucleotidase